MKMDEIQQLIEEQVYKTISSVKQEFKIALKKMNDRIENLENQLGINGGKQSELLNFFQSQLRSQIKQKESNNQNNEKTIFEQINEVLALRQELEKSQASFLFEIKENLVYKSELMKLQSKFDQLESNKKQNIQDNLIEQIQSQIYSEIEGLKVWQKNQELIINNLQQNQQQVQNQNLNHQRKNSQNQVNTPQQFQIKLQTSFPNQQQQQFQFGGFQQQQNLTFLDTQQS